MPGDVVIYPRYIDVASSLGFIRLSIDGKMFLLNTHTARLLSDLLKAKAYVAEKDVPPGKYIHPDQSVSG